MFQRILMVAHYLDNYPEKFTLMGLNIFQKSLQKGHVPGHKFSVNAKG